MDTYVYNSARSLCNYLHTDASKHAGLMKLSFSRVAQTDLNDGTSGRTQCDAHSRPFCLFLEVETPRRDWVRHI